MKTLPLILSAALLLGAALPAAAQQMNYQGRLTDASGNALADGQYTIEFSLWDAASAGTQVWGPYMLDGTAANGHGPKADLVNGRFNAVLGAVDTASRPLVDAFAATRYLQIKVGTNSPITPRQAILDAPSALSARTAVIASRLPNVYPSAENVGIGTETPASKFTVQTTGSGYGIEQTNGTHRFGIGSDNNGSWIGTRSNSNLRFFVNDGLSTGTAAAILLTNGRFRALQGFTADGGSILNGGSSVNGALIVSNDFGDTKVFEVTPAANSIYCYGSAFKPSGGSWSALSDIRLKKDVRDLSGALPKLLQLHPVTFDYKNPEQIGSKGRQTGFIAQEVEKIFPEWITESPLPVKSGDKADDTKYKSISISGFESLTVQALRELREEKDTQIKTLTAENTALRDTMKAQEARLAKLEQTVAALAPAEDKPAKATARR